MPGASPCAAPGGDPPCAAPGGGPPCAAPGGGPPCPAPGGGPPAPGGPPCMPGGGPNGSVEGSSKGSFPSANGCSAGRGGKGVTICWRKSSASVPWGASMVYSRSSGVVLPKR